MKSRVLLGLLCSVVAVHMPVSHAEQVTVINMGSELVKGHTLEPYSATWIQCSQTDQQWVRLPDITESLFREDKSWRIRQESKRPDGLENTARYWLSSDSLAPLSFQRVIHNADKEELVRVERHFSQDGFTERKQQGGQSQSIQGAVSNKMWLGSVLGLPLSSIDQDHFPISIATGMPVFNGTYSVQVNLAGEETVQVDGEKIRAYWLDVHWLHHESGDVYPPGPKASGGRYWVAAQGQGSHPRILQYQTDSYLVSRIQNRCPQSKS